MRALTGTGQARARFVDRGLTRTTGGMGAMRTRADDWRTLAAIDAARLTDARLQLHHAAQIIVSAAISYLPARADDSHTNMEWLPQWQALATNVIVDAVGLRFALRVHDLTLLALAGEVVRSAFPLDGKTLPQAVPWLSSELKRHGLDPARLTTKKHYEIPPHAVATGAPWQRRDGEAFETLADTYHDAWLVASAIERSTAGASPTRCWPHHFDLATLITLPPAADGSGRSIGVGLSPGDDSYAEPYFYVGPFPHPDPAGLGPLPVGHWHTAGWVGGVLTLTELAASGPDAGQRQRVTGYVETAVEVCRRVLTDA